MIFLWTILLGTVLSNLCIYNTALLDEDETKEGLVPIGTRVVRPGPAVTISREQCNDKSEFCMINIDAYKTRGMDHFTEISVHVRHGGRDSPLIYMRRVADDFGPIHMPIYVNGPTPIRVTVTLFYVQNYREKVLVDDGVLSESVVQVGFQKEF